MYVHNDQKIFGTEEALEEFKKLFAKPKVKGPKTPEAINKEPSTPNYPPPQTPPLPAPKSAKAKHRPSKQTQKGKGITTASKKPEDGTPVGEPGSISQLDVPDAISEVTAEKPPAKIEDLGGLHEEIMKCLELVS